MKLTRRLQAIADMVHSTNKVYDVGCDHAYLDIYLASIGFNCVAIDVRPQVIEFAKKNVNESGFQNKIEVILNDGLNDMPIEKNDTVILSGLGARTILDITKNQSITKLIIQSNDNLYLLRKTMMERNYQISEEQIVFEDNKFYIIIKFELSFKKYTDYELFLGPKLLEKKTRTFVDYLNNLQKHFETVLLKIPNNYLERQNDIQTLIDYIKMALK